DAALKAAIAELEKADTKNDPELEKQKQEVIEKLKEEAAKKRSDFVKRFKEGLTAKEAEKELDAANKKAEETTNPAPAEENKPAEQPKSEKGEALVQEELPEYPEIKKVGDSTGSPTKEEGRQSDNTAVNEPALVSKTPSASGTDAPAATPADAPATPAVAPTVAGTSQDNTYQAPAAKADDKKELPNTGGKDNVAIASLGFLGLLLGALPFVKRKN
ncbi:LPXTG cell wall anchor domain-containing protein, partial [Streptococcus mitis]